MPACLRSNDVQWCEGNHRRVGRALGDAQAWPSICASQEVDRWGDHAVYATCNSSWYYRHTIRSVRMRFIASEQDPQDASDLVYDNGLSIAAGCVLRSITTQHRCCKHAVQVSANADDKSERCKQRCKQSSQQRLDVVLYRRTYSRQQGKADSEATQGGWHNRQQRHQCPPQ